MARSPADPCSFSVTASCAALELRQNPATALDVALATYLDWERQDYQDTVQGIRQGHADLKAGRTQIAHEALEELRVKHGFPR